MPCILVVYDARGNQAYWLYLQAYFERLDGFSLAEIKETITVHIPTANVVDQSSIKCFAQYRDNVLNQIQGTIRHDI